MLANGRGFEQQSRVSALGATATECSPANFSVPEARGDNNSIFEAVLGTIPVIERHEG
jgi:hypothetical protein